MVYPKFIIEDGNLIISKCTFHHQLAINREEVKGGGWFRLKDGDMILYGESHDFGPAKLEDIEKAVKSEKVFSTPALYRPIANRYTFYYDTGSEIIKLSE